MEQEERGMSKYINKFTCLYIFGIKIFWLVRGCGRQAVVFFVCFEVPLVPKQKLFFVIVRKVLSNSTYLSKNTVVLLAVTKENIVKEK